MQLLELPFNPLHVDAGAGLTIEDFLNVFHSEMSGHIHHAYVDPAQPKYKQWIPRACNSLEEFSQRLTFNHSEYMTFNTTYYKNRKVEFLSKYNKDMVCNVQELNAFYIDVDIYSDKAKHRNDSQMFFDMLDLMVKHDVIPPYTFLMKSGNGYYVIWLIEKIKFSRKNNMKKKVKETLSIYDAIQRYLVNLFKDFGADGQCVAPVHVFGIPGTYNYKNGVKKRRYIVKYNEGAITTMKEFRQKYLPKDVDDAIFERYYPEFSNKKINQRHTKKGLSKSSTIKKEQNKKKQTRHKSASLKKVKKFNTIDKHNLIIADLQKLIHMRKGQAMEGYRSLISLMVRYSFGILKNDEIAVEQMLHLNSQFADPIEPTVLVEQTKHAVKAVEDFKTDKVSPHEYKLYRAGYNYSKKRMIELLHITPEEQEGLEYLVDHSVTYDRKKAKQKESIRDDYGLTSRDRKTLNAYMLVQQYKNEGKTQMEIAEITGINLRTVKRNWINPSGKNSDAIYAVYAEITTFTNSDTDASIYGDTKNSCYVG